MNEVIGRSHYGQLAVGSISMQDCIMLHRYGSEAQKARWLVPLVDGDIYPSVGPTEPEVAGSGYGYWLRLERTRGHHQQAITQE